jgi:hypothetical protein
MKTWQEIRNEIVKSTMADAVGKVVQSAGYMEITFTDGSLVCWDHDGVEEFRTADEHVALEAALEAHQKEAAQCFNGKIEEFNRAQAVRLAALVKRDAQ